MDQESPTFERTGNLVLFRQLGPKIDFPVDASNESYFKWLDEITASISHKVRGASLREKDNDRIDPRRNTGVYYDTADYRLLKSHRVLRTTSNPKTHAFCAFKHGIDSTGVRRDHRYVFDGSEKSTIQADPTGPAAVATVMRLLARTDITHPGTYLFNDTGLSGSDLSPALRIVQYRYTFYVLIDGEDALRCSLDRAEVSDLRKHDEVEARRFSEIELPIYPRIKPDVLVDPRVRQLMEQLSLSLIERFHTSPVLDSKYRRAAMILSLLDADSS